MIRNDIRKTVFAQEMDKDQLKYHFHTLAQKYIHNIDNLYYVAYLEGDCNENQKVQKLLEDLKTFKEMARTTTEEIVYDDDLVISLKRHDDYGICLTSPERYDIFFLEYLRNMETPRILVQIRAAPLWMEDQKELLEETIDKIKEIIQKHDLKILNVKENRIDYAYHTNCIQNPNQFFKDENIEKYLQTEMEFYTQSGRIKKNKLNKEYLALGRRKSNNTFIRIYNKTLEIIEASGKNYFIKIWFDNKIISRYDRYCLEHAFKKQEFDYVYEAAMLYYLEYGNDQIVKDAINSILQDPNTTLCDRERFATRYFPEVTKVTNIEFETKRKFYYNSDSMIETLPHQECSPELVRIYRILDNRKLFLNYLQTSTLNFTDGEKRCDWWDRLNRLKIDWWKDSDAIAIRDYSSRLHKERQLQMTVNKIGKAAVYNQDYETGFEHDILNVLSNLNDNHKRYELIDSRTKEPIQIIRNSKYLKDYDLYKQKATRRIKPLLDKRR
ncbi:hypothetical protein [Anaerotalea alkaliphila]|uniref:Uncharacterized protein n=1 Tax=Anaerotalea alkaliphila TaxID=2662126 RepID=A0A7X5HW29_9FIRM|nr:hypothetical protein [Anaerotalea alkaliphila]NDL67710.1 hypothetical protein [Anaerotalea alkaliphila]